MLKIIIIFMLLSLIGSPMNTSSPDNTSINNSHINNTSINKSYINNTSINKSYINNTSLNDTEESELRIDISLLNWFSKPVKTPVGLNLKLVLEDIKHDYLKNAVESYLTEKSMTEEDFSKRSIPPAINKKLEKYPELDVDDEEPTIGPEPPFDTDEDSWLQKPPWEEEIKRGCSEPVCDENGICYVECWD